MKRGLSGLRGLGRAGEGLTGHHSVRVAQDIGHNVGFKNVLFTRKTCF